VIQKSLEKLLPVVFVPKGFNRYFVSYLSPLNNGSKEETFFHINWMAYWPLAEQNKFRADIETFVLRSFWAHKKDCSLSVDGKINNTIKLVRRLAIALDEPD
jgi:hypothetical protein